MGSPCRSAPRITRDRGVVVKAGGLHLRFKKTCRTVRACLCRRFRNSLCKWGPPRLQCVAGRPWSPARPSGRGTHPRPPDLPTRDTTVNFTPIPNILTPRLLFDTSSPAYSCRGTGTGYSQKPLAIHAPIETRMRRPFPFPYTETTENADTMMCEPACTFCDYGGAMVPANKMLRQRMMRIN